MSTRTRVVAGQYAALAIYLLFITAPALWLFATAFKPPAEVFTVDPAWLPQHPTLDNFSVALNEQPLLRAAGNSLLISGSAAVLTVLLALPTANLLARHRGAVPRITMAWVLLSQMFPFILIAIPLFLLMITLGLYDSRLGLVLVYTVWNLPFAIWMLRNSIAAIPIELEEQARTDGAGELGRLRHVVAPLLTPGIVTAAMFAFVNSWNEFFFALVLISDEANAPLSLLLVRFIGVDGAVRLGPLAAASLLATLPSLLVFAAIQSRLTSGLLAGALKG